MAVDRVKHMLTRRTAGQAVVGTATCGYAVAISYPVVS